MRLSISQLYEPFFAIVTFLVGEVCQRLKSSHMKCFLLCENVCSYFFNNFLVSTRNVGANILYQPCFTSYSSVTTSICHLFFCTQHLSLVCSNDMSVDCFSDGNLLPRFVSGWSIEKPLITCSSI